MMQRLIPIVIIIAAIGLFFVYTSPTYSGPVADARAELQGLDSALQAAGNFKSREEELVAEREALPKDQLERLQKFLPDNVNNIQLILDLDALAARSGVRLANFNVGEQPTGDAALGEEGGLALNTTSPVGAITITLSATGTYPAFMAFLESAERSLRLLDLVALNVKSSSTGVYTYDMTFRIYWLQ